MTFWYLVISLPLLPVYLMILMCLIVYKKLIFTILRLRHGNDLTPIESIDSLFTIGKFEDNFSYIFTIINTNIKEEDLEEKLVEAFDVKIIQNHEHFKRYLSSLRSFMGYSFLMREKIDATDFVNVLDVEKNGYESINHLAYEYSIKPLPKQNKLLSEMIILKCSAEWKAKNNLKVDQIPLLMRIHHGLGDGLSTMNLLIQLFGDNKLIIDEAIEEFNIRRKRSKFWIRIFQNIYFFLLVPGFLVCYVTTMFTNKRLSLKIVGSGKQYFAWQADDNKMLVKKIKEFKKNIRNCSFSEILFAAISASLYDYFKKKNCEIPITIGAFIATVPNLETLNENGLPILRNQMAFSLFEIPIEIRSESMLKRISAIKKYTRSPTSFIDLLILRFLICHLLGLIPSLIKDICCKTKYTCMGLSNLPGLHKFTFFNGIELDGAYFFVVNRGETGLGFSIFTYDDKIHIGLKVYENIISTQEDCQFVVDNVFKHLNELIVESCNKNV